MNKTRRLFNFAVAALIILVLLLPAMVSCNKDNSMTDLAYGENALLEAAVMADLHYVSPTLIDSTDNECFSEKKADPKLFAASSAIIKSAIDDVIESGVKYLFIAGDLCDTHALASHNELSEIFKQAKEQGLQIFVAPGNHDVAPEGYLGYKYTSSGLVRVPDFHDSGEKTISQQFKEIYFDFGYKQAVNVEGLSYAADVGEKHRLIVIDNCSEDLTQSTINWAKQQVEYAISANKVPIAMMHKPIDNMFKDLSIFMNLITGGGNATTENAQLLKSTLMDAGCKFVLSGHNHANNIAKLTNSDETKILYDIMTNSLVQSDNSYRRLRFSENFVVGTVEELKTVNSTYFPDCMTETEKSNIVLSLKDASETHLKNFLRLKIEQNRDAIKTAFSNAIYGEGVTPDSKFEPFMEKAVFGFLNMPFYKDLGENSMEALYEKHGAELPQSDFTDIFDLLAKGMTYIFSGKSENISEMTDMIGATIKALIASVIDEGLFELSDVFYKVDRSILKATVDNLLKKGEFEVFNSYIAHNLLQLPIISKIRKDFGALAGFLPERIYNAQEFSDFIENLELAGEIFKMQFAKYFENTTDGSDNTIYTGKFYSDKCLKEQIFENLAKNFVSDPDVPNRNFVLEKNTGNFEKL